MTENRLIGIAAAALVPCEAAVMVASFMVAGTYSSMPLVIAVLVLSVAGMALYFLASVGTFLLLVDLSRKRTNRTNWLSVAILITTVAAATWYASANWSYGTRYQGARVTLAFACLNVASAIAIASALAYNASRPTLRSNLVANWLLTNWVFSWAFPWLGEYL